VPTHSLEPSHANPLTTRPLCRQVCNHPFLFDEYKLGTGNEFLIRACGKLAILDRILPKLQVSAFGQACMCSLPLYRCCVCPLFPGV
jgi:SNF2 family DNA or RNA helicase